MNGLNGIISLLESRGLSLKTDDERLYSLLFRRPVDRCARIFWWALVTFVAISVVTPCVGCQVPFSLLVLNGVVLLCAFGAGTFLRTRNGIALELGFMMARMAQLSPLKACWFCFLERRHLFACQKAMYFEGLDRAVSTALRREDWLAIVFCWEGLIPPDASDVFRGVPSAHVRVFSAFAIGSCGSLAAAKVLFLPAPTDLNEFFGFWFVLLAFLGSVTGYLFLVTTFPIARDLVRGCAMFSAAGCGLFRASFLAVRHRQRVPEYFDSYTD